MLRLYNLFLVLYAFAIRWAAAWNPKAKAWVTGRKNINQQLLKLRPHAADKTVWMHCSSLGEFEQGRPLLEAIRHTYPHYKILLSFFSPSGYEVRKHYELADMVCYMPLDGKRRSATFLDLASPELAIFVKYEHWHYYLTELERRKIPAICVSALFRDSQPFFKAYGGFWRKMLKQYLQIFVQDTYSLEKLSQIGLATSARISGDTRFDRVLTVASTAAEIPWLEEYVKNKAVIVAGSTWPEDEKMLSALLYKDPELRMILAPHEINEEHLLHIERIFPDSERYSVASRNFRNPGTETPTARVIIIDNFGMLSSLYRYATLAYVGGGFNRSGIHNILEAAVYGIPVIFGPNYQRSREASDMVRSGIAFSVRDSQSLEKTVSGLLHDKANLQNIGAANATYVRSNAGATHIIMDYIEENRLLSN